MREEVVVEAVGALLDRVRAVVEELGPLDCEDRAGRRRRVEHDEGTVGSAVGRR